MLSTLRSSGNPFLLAPNKAEVLEHFVRMDLVAPVRPQHFTADNDVRAHSGLRDSQFASMRPRHFTADNISDSGNCASPHLLQ